MWNYQQMITGKPSCMSSMQVQTTRISLSTIQHLLPVSLDPPPFSVNLFHHPPSLSIYQFLPIASLPTLASPTFLDMEDDKNIEMVAVDERNSSKEGSVENGVVKTAQADASEKGILDVCPIYGTN
jgi:hypothetical protein